MIKFVIHDHNIFPISLIIVKIVQLMDVKFIQITYQGSTQNAQQGVLFAHQILFFLYVI